jgi:hypothetical protein
LKKTIYSLIVLFLVLFLSGCKDNLVEIKELTDDFSNKKSGWDISTKNDYITNYEKNKYEIQVLNSEIMAWSDTPEGNLGISYMIEVDVEVIQGEPACGLLFNYVDESDFYRFAIKPDTESYSLHRLYNGRWYTIINWTHSNDINQGVNRLRILHNRNKIKLYVNNTFLASAKIEFNNGQNKGALAVDPLGSLTPVTTYFDNFKYRGYNLKENNDYNL